MWYFIIYSEIVLSIYQWNHYYHDHFCWSHFIIIYETYSVLVAKCIMNIDIMWFKYMNKYIKYSNKNWKFFTYLFIVRVFLFCSYFFIFRFSLQWNIEFCVIFHFFNFSILIFIYFFVYQNNDMIFFFVIIVAVVVVQTFLFLYFENVIFFLTRKLI